MYFAKNLRFLRRKAELSQSDLGDKVATDYNTISRYESGKSTPKLEMLTKLAQVFGVSIEEMRNLDLAVQPVPIKVEEPGPAYQDAKRHRSSAVVKPIKSPLRVSIELDGTPACLEQAIARLTAINGLLTDLD
jgi:transcriptional regulator with XRE-family HTH domain